MPSVEIAKVPLLQLRAATPVVPRETGAESVAEAVGSVVAGVEEVAELALHW